MNLNYEVVRSKRKTMAIHVYRDQLIKVRVPLDSRDSEIDAFVMQYQDWIHKKLDESRQFPGLDDSQYCGGGFLWLLGQYISIIVSQGQRNSVQLEKNTLYIHQINTNDEKKTLRLINIWKREYASDLFQQRLRYWYEQFPIPMKAYQFRLRKMKRQWGNCNRKGVITINSQLVRYPADCIDYVIVHELTHLQHLHHGNAFYQLLEKVLPDWQQYKKLLTEFSGL
ncbi:MAG: M48 family metallopeptidase [Gammaproteobacteria bacterium]|nr:M48 family metallopeptidase [Gammaproteobacteria bacterium]